MDIAFFTETYFPQINGVTYTIDSWQEVLEEMGHNVYVIYPKSDHEPGDHEFPIPAINFRPVDGYHIGISRPGRLLNRLPDVDIVHTHGQFSMGILGVLMARKHSVPVVASHHTPGEQYFDYVSHNSRVQQVMDRIYLWWERRFYNRCHTVLAPSQAACTELRSRIERRVQPLSNGVNTAFFSPAADTTVAAFREEHGIDDGPVIGYCGRLGYEKHLEDLAALSDQFDGTIVVAGDGFAKDYYLQQFEDAGVQYLGRLPRQDMPTFYSLLDAFVIPSTAETQGIAVLEANACGTPAVGADAKALRDTIKVGRNGKRYPPGNVSALHDQVQTVLEQNGQLSTGARNVAQEHSIENVVEELVDVYRDCCTEGCVR